MRAWRHLTPRYVFDRVNLLIYHKRYPDHPWLTKLANMIISSYLKKDDIGLEFGSGRSTLYFSQIVSFLTSVEHDQHWYSKINEKLISRGVTNVDYRFCPSDTADVNSEDSENEYVQICHKFPQNSLDFVLVDGMYRSIVANLVIDKIRPGGLLIFDNANWYLPCNSVSPTSRTISQGPASSKWGIFLNNVQNWRCIWTSNGVCDTALYFKPCQTN